MQRTIQIQVLSWLAALATLGAAVHPTFDTILFAVAFVFGALVLHVRERLVGETPFARVLAGQVVGAAMAWALVALRAFTAIGARFPAKLSAAMLVAAAVVPTGIVLVELALAASRRVGRRVAARRTRVPEE